MTDTPSKTETALLALVAALAAASELEGAPLPPPERNNDLVTQMVADESNTALRRYLNVIDGDRGTADELLGTDFGNVAGFDCIQQPRVEFAVAGGTSAEREAAFDGMKRAIWDALKPAVDGDTLTYLGGAVDSLVMLDMLPPDQSSLARSGVPGCKGSDFLLALSFTSTRPF